MIGASLAAISILWGLAALLIFRRFTDQAALRKVRKRLYAHLLEIRLYSEEPALVFRAQKELIVNNFRFLVLVAKPVLIMAVPFALLYGPLDSVYGWGPLVVGHSAIVTMQAPGPGQYTLLAPGGIAVETPAVAVIAERQISWRIRALTPTHGNLRFVGSGVAEISRSVAAGGRTLSSYQRRKSLAEGLWVEVDYPKASVAIAGMELPWLAWFLILSTLSAGLFTLF